MFKGTNLTLSSDVDQDTYGKVTKTQENTTHKRAKMPALSQQVITMLQGSQMHRSFTRPVLEYASQAWEPTSSKSRLGNDCQA